MHRRGRHLEGAKEEVEKELGGAQRALGVLICHEGEHHLVDPQQRYEGQRGLGQPAGAEPEPAGPALPPASSSCPLPVSRTPAHTHRNL